MKVFVLDNYDSFTFNLVQYLGELGADIEVRRSDQITIDGVAALAPDAIVISPGPGGPSDAGISVGLVDWCAHSRTPLLGVCLGHQAIAAAFGGVIVPAPDVMHGKTSEIHHHGEGALRGLLSPFVATRYHSLVVDRATLPTELRVTAWTSDDLIMGIRHTTQNIEGVQFHPEAILTEHGMTLVRNFLEDASSSVTAR
jgi:anthranilate synthase/aminodeoxychorismate synthase-like glutamine amidotransferase